MRDYPPNLEFHRPFAGEAHGQGREPVPGDVVHRTLFTFVVCVVNQFKDRERKYYENETKTRPH